MDQTIVLVIHLTWTHYDLTLLFLKVVITLKILMSSLNEKWETNCHYDKANHTDYIEISANTSTLKSEMILKNNYKIDFRQDNSINSLLGFHSKRYTSGFHNPEIWLIFLLSTAYSSILILFQVVMLMVPHNPQFTHSFQMSLLDIKWSKIVIIFFTFQ